MSVAKLLVVDDDPSVRRLLERFLLSRDYDVAVAEDGCSALQLFAAFDPDLVILDVNLPDTNGFKLCRTMKDERSVGIMMLTSLTDETYITNSLYEGADDYITKPFSLSIVAARITALLRRMTDTRDRAKIPQLLEFDNLTIDPQEHRVVRNGESIILTPLEFKLLHCLAKRPGQVWQRADLIQHVWEHDFLGDNRVVDVHIGQLRKKVELDFKQPDLIQTVRGVGYKFQPP